MEENERLEQLLRKATNKTIAVHVERLIPTFIPKLSLAPFVVFDDKLYQASNTEGGNDYLQIGEIKIPLLESSPIAELEEYDKQLSADSVFSYKKEFIEKKLEQEIQNEKEFKKLLGDEKIIHYIINDIFPCFIDDDVDTLLTGKKATPVVQTLDQLMAKEVGDINVSKKEIEAIKLELLGNENNDEGNVLTNLLGKFYGNIKPIGSILGNILGASLIMDSKVYTLKGQSEGGLQVYLKGQKYGALLSSDITAVESKYHEALKNIFLIEAVTEFEGQLEEIQKVRKRNKVFKKFCDKDGYEIGKVGFLKANDYYFVYVKVPKFAMQSPHYPSKYYPFPECRVAVRLYYSEGRICAANPLIIEKIMHPFVENSSMDFQPICLGSYVKHNASQAEGIVANISGAINIIQNGFINGNNPHHHLGDLKIKPLNRPEASDQGYMITNEHKVK